MIVDKFHEIISVKQSKSFEKNTNFPKQRTNLATNDFEQDL